MRNLHSRLGVWSSSVALIVIGSGLAKAQPIPFGAIRFDAPAGILHASGTPPETTIPRGAAVFREAAVNNQEIPVPDAPLTTRNAATPSGITYTCDATINIMPGVCDTLNSTIAGIYASKFSNANASIYITFGKTSLGASLAFFSSLSYAGYRASLERNVTDASDVTAFANSVPVTNPISSSFRVALTNPLLRALSFTPLGGVQADGTRCTIGVNVCYDGVITISSAFQSAGGLFYRTAGTISPNQADFYTVVEHETDEILGTISCAPDGCGGGFIAPTDLFRYHSDGARSFAAGPNDSCSFSSATNACFSLNGVQMLQRYNNVDDGRDLGDWVTDCSKPLVQAANACGGISNLDISPAAEILVLDAIGFRLKQESPIPLSVLTKQTSDIDGTAGNTCFAAPPMTNFPASTAKIWFYFTVAAGKSGDTVQIQFQRPDGMIYSNATFSGFPVSATGFQCFTASIDVNGTSAANFPGVWKVQAFWNQSATPLLALNFTLSTASQCTYSIDSGGQAFAASGGAVSVSIATQPGCFWTISNPPDWVNLSDLSGSGTKSVTLQTAANLGPARSSRLTVANFPFNVEQQAASVPGLNFLGSLAHLASQAGWSTTFTAVNHGSGAAQTRFSAYDDSGSALPLPITFPQQASSAAPIQAASLDRTLPLNASLLLNMADQPGVSSQQGVSLKMGSAQFSATDAVAGFAVLRYSPTRQEAVVQLETRNASSYLLAYDNAESRVLGVAVTSFSTQSTDAPLVIRDETGAQIGSGSIRLPAGGHTAFILSDQFPVTTNGRGTVEFDTPAGGRIAVTAIRFTSLGTFTTIPVFANVDASGGLIPHFASGPAWQSTFVLVNTGAAAAHANLRFWDDSGSPLALPLASSPSDEGAASLVSVVDRTLAAGAMLVMDSAGANTGALLTGSALLTTEGNISGFVILRYLPNGQETVVPLENRRASAYLVPFDHTAGTVTGVAVASGANHSTPLTILIRDDRGLLIGSGSISLPANGHSAFRLADKFPVTSGIRGTVEFDAPSGTYVGVAGIRTPPALTFATLPTITK